MNDDDADLEPIDPLGPPGPLESARGPARREGGSGARETARSGRRARRRVWAVLAGAAAFWIAAVSWIAISPDHRRSHERASVQSTSAPAATTSVPSFGSDPFGEASGRFAAVVDGRVWLVDAGRREALGVPGVPRARIVASSGWSLLVESEDPQHPRRRFVVDGRSGGARPAADGTGFPRIGGGWWIATDGELTSGAERVALPAGVVAVAQVNGGFVIAPASAPTGASASDGALSLWDPRSGSQRALGRLPNTRFLGADANRIALSGPRCPAPASPKCSIDIVEVATGSVTSLPVPFPDQFVRNAVFSRDGRRMAIWGTKGVSLHDTANGSALVTLTAARLATLPLTFTSDSRALLVLEDPEPYRQVVVLRAADGRFVRTWVSAQHLEQLVAFARP